MTPFEQAVARSYGGDMRCLIAGCSLEHIKQRMRSVSHYPVRGRTYWMDTTTKGIALRDRDNRDSGTVLRWRDVSAHIRCLPTQVRDAARDVDHDAHCPPASTLEWHDPFAPRRRTEAEALAYRLWAQHVEERTAAVLARAFPEADCADEDDLFSAVGISL